MADAATRHNVLHIPDIDRTDLGTPLISDAFKKAEGLALAPMLCYANCDIVFFSDVVEALRLITFDRFLLVGRRRDTDVGERLDLEEPSVRRDFRHVVERDATLGTKWQMDYFIFPAGIQWDFPPFAVGRAGWDGWFIRRARKLRVPVVDLSSVVLAVHQNHDYEHVPRRIGSFWHGPETDRNLELAGPMGGGTIIDATHRLEGYELKRTPGGARLRAGVLRIAEGNRYLRPPVTGARALHRLWKRFFGTGPV